MSADVPLLSMNAKTGSRPRSFDAATVERAARAWMTCLRIVASKSHQGHFNELGTGLFGFATGSPIATLNGYASIAMPADEETSIDRLAGQKPLSFPWSLTLRLPEPTPSFVQLASSMGLNNQILMPFMLKELGPDDIRSGANLIDTVSSTEDPAVHRRLLAQGFAAPEEIFTAFCTDHLFKDPSVTAYVGRVGGEDVATGLSIIADGCVGIFNVATPPEHRRRGYGRAVVSRLLCDALTKGASVAALHSSLDAVPFYESMEFRRAESWSVFL
ncbi:GNAT family N-acetyltransferase [Rhizobium leguminosarum]|nr:GNAT family N-acetyltransferase [Rhizobium leguminosarum]